MSQEELKRKVGHYAASLVKDGQILGMGTGSTISWFAKALGNRVRDGETFLAIPTSYQARILCRENGIGTTSLDDHDPEIAFDGADEVNPNNQLIKGRGGAHTQEKIVDYAAKEFYVLIDQSKLVQTLGTSFPVPIEVIPLAAGQLLRTLSSYGTPVLRMAKAKDGPVISDNGNFIIDLYTKVNNPIEFEHELNNMPGSVENGIFTKPCKIIVAYDDVIDIK